MLAQEIAANRYKMLLRGLAPAPAPAPTRPETSETQAQSHTINFTPSGARVPTDGGKQQMCSCLPDGPGINNHFRH